MTAPEPDSSIGTSMLQHTTAQQQFATWLALYCGINTSADMLMTVTDSVPGTLLQDNAEANKLMTGL